MQHTAAQSHSSKCNFKGRARRRGRDMSKKIRFRKKSHIFIFYKKENFTVDGIVQNRTKPDKTGQNRTKPDNTGQYRTKMIKTGQKWSKPDKKHIYYRIKSTLPDKSRNNRTKLK